MAKQLPSVDTNADTFYAWIVKTNGIVNLCNTEVVTANNSANGAVTTGVGYVIGKLGANTLVCDTLSGGNTLSTGVLTITSNAVFSTPGFVRVDNGVTLGANVVHEHGLRVQTSNTSSQTIDTFDKTLYRTAKYVISLDNGSGVYQSTEILCTHDGTTTYTTEYATLYTGAVLATFSSDIVANQFRLIINPTVSSIRTSIDRRLIN